MAAENRDNVDVQFIYVNSLFNLSYEQDLLERTSTIEELERLAAYNKNINEIHYTIMEGINNLMSLN